MKILIAVKSHAAMHEQGAHEAIRNSWGRQSPHDVYFFAGGGARLGAYADEIHLNVPDDYDRLNGKVNAILEWSMDRGYDYTLLVDTDTFLIPHRLDALPWEHMFDYAGWIVPWQPRFAFGGCGYVVSRRAAHYVTSQSPRDAMDDVSIGKLLIEDERFHVLDAPIGWNRGIAWHFPKNVYAVKSYNPKFPWQGMMADAYLPGRFPRRLMWYTPIGGIAQAVELFLTSEDRVDDFPNLILQRVQG